MLSHTALSYEFSVVLTVLMLLVIVLDTVRYIIPNWLNLAIMLIFIVGELLLPINILSAIGAAAVVLLVGLGIFALGLMGGGDVKLLAMLTLWTGWSIATPQFLALTGVFGGLLVVVVLPLRFFARQWANSKDPVRRLPRLLTKNEPVPYGIAIAWAFLYLLTINGIPSLAI